MRVHTYPYLIHLWKAPAGTWLVTTNEAWLQSHDHIRVTRYYIRIPRVSGEQRAFLPRWMKVTSPNG